MIVERILEEQATIVWLPISQIGIDMTYQRYPAIAKIRAIAANFNENAAGLLTVSQRSDETYVVVDGNHRLEAMKKQGILLAQCQVCRGLTVEQEAEIYIWCNTARKQPDALDQFKARLIKNDPIVLAIRAIVEKHGLSIQLNTGTGRGGSRGKNALWAVTALETIYTKGKEKLLDEVLILATRSWPHEANVLEAKVLLGIMQFHIKYQGKYSREEFLAKMNVTDLKSIFRRAQYHAENGGHSGSAFAKALEEAYNKGKRTRRLADK